MEKRYELAQGRGSLTLAGEGDRLRISARLADDGRGLYKVFLLGRGGRFPLGTLMPEGGALVLARTVSRSELERRGFWPPAGARVELAFARGGGAPPSPPAGWRREASPGRLMSDPLLRAGVRELRGCLIRREGEGFRLAFPWRADRAFALPAIFCFASVERVGEENYAVFTFNGRGRPVFRINREDGEILEG